MGIIQVGQAIALFCIHDVRLPGKLRIPRISGPTEVVTSEFRGLRLTDGEPAEVRDEHEGGQEAVEREEKQDHLTQAKTQARVS